MRKLTLEEIQRNAARFGGRCVSQTYIDSLTPMEWECAAGHRWRAVAHAVRQGHWCKRCSDERLRLPATAVHAVAAARGGKCLAERYTNSQAKLEWQCALGHRWRSSFNSVKQGAWCPQCRAEARAEERATRQANGSAPEPNVTSAAAEPMPVP